MISTLLPSVPGGYFRGPDSHDWCRLEPVCINSVVLVAADNANGEETKQEEQIGGEVPADERPGRDEGDRKWSETVTELVLLNL